MAWRSEKGVTAQESKPTTMGANKDNTIVLKGADDAGSGLQSMPPETIRNGLSGVGWRLVGGSWQPQEKL